MNPDRLGAIDETYLAIENPSTPLHVASLGIFEGGGLTTKGGRLRYEAICERLDARMHLLPRLRQKVVGVPGGVARPVWLDDEHFDIANHVDVAVLAGGEDEGALLRFTEELIMEPLARDRPLWHLQWVTGLAGGRVALIERAHHAMVDGVSGVDVSLALLDARRDAPAGEAPVWSAAPTPSPAALLVDGLRDQVAAPVDAARRMARELLHPDRLVHDVAEVTDAVTALVRNTRVRQACSLNRPLGSTRRLGLVRQRLETVRAAGGAHGATVNDVVVAAVGGALRDLFLGRGEPLPADRVVSILVPVSVRSPDEAMALGNRVGGLVVAVPIGIGDPVERLRAVTATTSVLKGGPEAATADALLRAADLLPAPVVRALQRGLDHQPLVNMVVTNIPGPDFPLYALGSRLLEAFPVVPLGAHMSLEVAVVSYDGALNLGVTSDRDACPDAEVFTAGLERAFDELGASWKPALR